jgi:CHRD domain
MTMKEQGAQAPDNLGMLLIATLLALVSAAASGEDVNVNLSGAEESPPVATSATGHGTIRVDRDNSVSGSLVTSGIEGTTADIHVGARGQAGPPIITLTKSTDGRWLVPAGAKLTDEQASAFKSGRLYVNVHSDQHQPGEIRAQLKP